MSLESFSQPTPPPEKQKTIEFEREAIDKLSTETSKDIYQIDAFIDGKGKLPEINTPITQKYREALKSLEGKNSEELRTIIDPEGKFNPQEFSLFEISEGPPGAIHLELGNSADLAKLRDVISKGKLGALMKLAGLGDQREVESCGGQYLPPQVFAGGNYLGVIVNIREHNQDSKAQQKVLRHEYSHALMQEVIRPLWQRKVVDIGLGDRLTKVRGTVVTLGQEKANQLAEALGVVPNPNTLEHMKPLVIGKNIYDEQYLLDELRAYTYSDPILYPKRQITDISLEGEDAPGNASVELAKKYFEVNLLHTKARLISRESRSRSLAILGSTLSLEQAKRLLERDSANWKFDDSESNDSFEDTFNIFAKWLNDPEFEVYRDFKHQQGGELISQDRMRQIILPSKEMVDAEITRRYGDIKNAPEEFQQNYSAIYSG